MATCPASSVVVTRTVAKIVSSTPGVARNVAVAIEGVIAVAGPPESSVQDCVNGPRPPSGVAVVGSVVMGTDVPPLLNPATALAVLVLMELLDAGTWPD